MDKSPSSRFAHAPTLLIRTESTQLSKVDPLKAGFRRLFELLPPHARGHVVRGLPGTLWDRQLLSPYKSMLIPRFRLQVAGIGEFFGTTVFIFMAFATVQVSFISSNNNNQGNIDTSVSSVTPQELLYISMGVAFALAVTTWTFFRISGGLFNPVVSLGMGLIGALTWARVAILCVVQTVGTIAAAYMVSALFPGGLNVGTALHPHVSLAQGTIIEMLLTAQLVFSIFMLAAEKHDATFIAPVGIGLSLFIAEMIGVFWTGGSLNPVRSLAPAIVTRSFPTYHWIYWVGPTSGSILAVLIYKLIKALEYETAQDDDKDKQPILPTSTRRDLEGSSSGDAPTINVESETPATPPAQRSSATLQVPTYSKTPFVHDKESEKPGLPTCTGD
ncbi:Aquaporin-2 [Hyphodiscus hymeniophilus]|uniref:Aquaporin-2 n=1 Tax=Hyphodiscus hymeniophilus TaxID=353542 RepID=A0A9P7AU71_9HELO|nr:Aquaporin-2 [Hyphodiscus hymeniophilus]